MYKLILVVDGTRARWFRVEDARLIENEDLVCPEHRMLDRDRYSETKTGRWQRSAGLGPTHSVDDHRDRHDREVERRFAQQIGEVTERLRNELLIQEVIIAGKARMVGLLREALGGMAKHGVQLIEVEKNMAQWTRDEIQDALAAEGLLEARPRGAAAHQ